MKKALTFDIPFDIPNIIRKMFPAFFVISALHKYIYTIVVHTPHIKWHAFFSNFKLYTSDSVIENISSFELLNNPNKVK